MTRHFTIVPAGEFRLAESGRLGFGQRLAPMWDGVMRLAFCVDGYREQVGVEVRQDAAGRVRCTVHGTADLAAVRRQVARCLSLDHDGTGFGAVGQRDPVIGRLQSAAPGLRPPLFYSPYEAAVWAVLAARRTARLMAEVRRRLSEAYGTTFELAGLPVAALPTPAQLLTVAGFPGLSPQKIDWLHGIARAALAGRLDAATLQAMEPGAAMAQLRTIKGIGPFYSSLIVIRGTGLADVLPVNEPRLLALVTDLYGLPGAPTEAEFQALAEPWRPFRTWAAVLIRAAADRLDPADAA
ncbi:MAG TPA: DNA-3-methyladenine glycosylase 2 family protein [Mycobacteriales bacterium]|nr:DNA-3-methyladenine glycosylase 2 family protein [Mycobacteriales bacterium]